MHLNSLKCETFAINYRYKVNEEKKGLNKIISNNLGKHGYIVGDLVAGLHILTCQLKSDQSNSGFNRP